VRAFFLFGSKGFGDGTRLSETGRWSTKLSPLSADKELDFAVFSRMTPVARMRPSSARRASDDMRSGHRGLGPETGPVDVGDMATFHD